MFAFVCLQRKSQFSAFKAARFVSAFLILMQINANAEEKSASGSLQAPQEISGTEIIDKRGAKIFSDVSLFSHEGEKVNLSNYFSSDNVKPVILTLGYYQCPMLCNLVLNGLLDSLKTMSLRIGKDFRVISISINPEESSQLAKDKRANYLKSVNWNSDTDWTFFVGEENQVRKIAESVGFQYKYHERSKEYIHSAGIFILSPDGVLSRTLYGINYKPADLKMSLIDAGNNKIGSLLDRVILSCFHYDPDSHKYGFYVFGIMRIGGILTILILSVVLFLYWRSEKYLKAN